MHRPFDLLVFGATGFTGRLVAEYLNASDGVGGALRVGDCRPQPRQACRYEVLFIGETANGQTLRATVKGDRDSGYGSTSKMIAESALCLVNDVGWSTTPGGVWAAGSAMGMALVRRLQMHAGLSFSIEDQ